MRLLKRGTPKTKLVAIRCSIELSNSIKKKNTPLKIVKICPIDDNPCHPK